MTYFSVRKWISRDPAIYPVLIFFVEWTSRKVAWVKHAWYNYAIWKGSNTLLRMICQDSFVLG